VITEAPIELKHLPCWQELMDHMDHMTVAEWCAPNSSDVCVWWRGERGWLVLQCFSFNNVDPVTSLAPPEPQINTEAAVVTMCEMEVLAADLMSDDVFESPGDAPGSAGPAPAPGLGVSQEQMHKTPSPTGYPDYQPPAQLLAGLPPSADADAPVHKTILLGDSGVGKTSLLVQFDTGRFQSGNFSATVGIGFTESTRRRSAIKATLRKIDNALKEDRGKYRIAARKRLEKKRDDR
ncbi:Uncharacterized protein GBIM_05738, partial [Gryllus bimaculatus]